MYLDFAFRNSSALELSNPYCHIAMVALERHSNTYGLSRHKSANTWIHTYTRLLRHAPDYNGMKEVMLPVTNTCTIPREMWAGFCDSHTCSCALLEKYQRPVRTAMEQAHPTSPRQSFHLCTCLAAPPYMTHSSALQIQTTHDVDVHYCTALWCEWRPNKTCLIVFI